MGLSSVFDAFVRRRPVCVMARGVLERMFEPSALDELVERKARRGFTRDLLFSSLVHLMADVVLGVRPNVHAAFQFLDERDEIGVSLTAVYKKLDRVEPAVSAALVEHSARLASEIVDALGARRESWLPGYRIRLLDGNAPSATEHRLKVLRDTWAAPLPGKILVVFDPERGVAEKVFLTEDGHAQERSLLGEVQSAVEAGDLWMAARNFCTLGFLFGIRRRKAFFLMRQHWTIKGTLVGERRKGGRSETGEVFEQTIRLKDPETGEEVDFRRITVVLDKATRDGDGELHLVSNIPAEEADAVVLAELSRKRWTIETLFQEVTATLQCEIRTLGYPKAALFAFCLALMASNGIAVLKGAMRAEHGEATAREEISGYFLALELKGTYEGMMIAIPDDHWRIFGTMSVSQFAGELRELARRMVLKRYRKHPRGPKKPPPKKSAYKDGGHVSTWKRLNGVE